MKKHLAILFLFLPILLFSQSDDTKYDPNKQGAGVSKRANQLGAMLDASLQIGTGENVVEFTVYEASENARYDDKPSSPAYGRLFSYCVIPAFQITKIKAVTNVATPYVALEFTPLKPDNSSVLRYLRTSNPNADAGRIRPAIALGFLINYPNALTYSKDCGGGCSLGSPVLARLDFKNAQDARLAATNLTEDASELEFECTFNFKLTVRNFFRIHRDDLMQSSVYRDFFSPIAGKKITVIQNQLASAAMRRDLESLVKQESDDDEFFLRALDDVWQLLVDPKDIVIPFEQITKAGGAVSALADFTNDKRYATDVIRRVASDARNLTDVQWTRKYKNDFLHVLDKSHDKIIDGSTDADIMWGLFGGSASFNYENHNKFKEELKKLVDTEDGGRKIFQNSFKYTWDGEKYEPKGIIAHEVIDFNTQSVHGNTFEKYRYVNELRRREMTVFNLNK